MGWRRWRRSSGFNPSYPPRVVTARSSSMLGALRSAESAASGLGGGRTRGASPSGRKVRHFADAGLVGQLGGQLAALSPRRWVPERVLREGGFCSAAIGAVLGSGWAIPLGGRRGVVVERATSVDGWWSAWAGRSSARAPGASNHHPATMALCAGLAAVRLGSLGGCGWCVGGPWVGRGCREPARGSRSTT